MYYDDPNNFNYDEREVIDSSCAGYDGFISKHGFLFVRASGGADYPTHEFYAKNYLKEWYNLDLDDKKALEYMQKNLGFVQYSNVLFLTEDNLDDIDMPYLYKDLKDDNLYNEEFYDNLQKLEDVNRKYYEEKRSTKRL